MIDRYFRLLVKQPRNAPSVSSIPLLTGEVATVEDDGSVAFDPLSPVELDFADGSRHM
jgi:hypothetical protein